MVKCLILWDDIVRAFPYTYISMRILTGIGEVREDESYVISKYYPNIIL